MHNYPSPKAFSSLKAKAFSLLELMIVVAIIAILGSLAIPAYEKYTVRAKLVDAISTLDSYKKSINMFYNINRRLPTKSSDVLEGPVNVPFDDEVTEDLPQFFEKFHYFSESGGIIFNVIIAETIFPDTDEERRTVSLGAKINEDSAGLLFTCGNYDSSTGLENVALLPKGCQEKEVSSWLSD